MKSIKLFIGIILFITQLHFCDAIVIDTMWKLPNARSVLVFSPHPDDDILGCGGTLLKHINQGSKVAIVYMTSGEAATWPYGPAELAKLREEEAQKAAAHIGVNNLVFLREPDGKLQQSNDIVEKVINLLKINQPDLIYTPHDSDSHPDHVATCLIVKEAVKKLSLLKPTWNPEHLSYEVWTPLCNITHASDISEVMSVKLAALKEHETQTQYMNFLEAVKGLNRYRGIMAFSGSYAECFARIDYSDQIICKGE